MKIRHKQNPSVIWFSNRFNISALDEIIVQHIELGADSDYIKDYDVFLESKQEWKDMRQAFKNHDIIIDNYNTTFFEPKSEKDRTRGFTL
jgi:hypothetical protein